MGTLTVRKNNSSGAQITTESRTSLPNVTYNGSNIVSSLDGSKTCLCKDKMMKTNLVCGGKTLNCKDKMMPYDVWVNYQKSQVNNTLSDAYNPFFKACTGAIANKAYFFGGDYALHQSTRANFDAWDTSLVHTYSHPDSTEISGHSWLVFNNGFVSTLDISPYGSYESDIRSYTIYKYDESMTRTSYTGNTPRAVIGIGIIYRTSYFVVGGNYYVCGGGGYDDDDNRKAFNQYVFKLNSSFTISYAASLGINEHSMFGQTASNDSYAFACYDGWWRYNMFADSGYFLRFNSSGTMTNMGVDSSSPNCMNPALYATSSRVFAFVSEPRSGSTIIRQIKIWNASTGTFEKNVSYPQGFFGYDSAYTFTGGQSVGGRYADYIPSLDSLAIPCGYFHSKYQATASNLYTAQSLKMNYISSSGTLTSENFFGIATSASNLCRVGDCLIVAGGWHGDGTTPSRLNHNAVAKAYSIRYT